MSKHVLIVSRKRAGVKAEGSRKPIAGSWLEEDLQLVPIG